MKTGLKGGQEGEGELGARDEGRGGVGWRGEDGEPHMGRTEEHNARERECPHTYRGVCLDRIRQTWGREWQDPGEAVNVSWGLGVREGEGENKPHKNPSFWDMISFM